MNEKVLILISEIILASAVIIALVIILIASWYDMQTTPSRKQLRRIANTLHKPRQPSVTVVVHVRNHDDHHLLECLKSIRQLKYANYQILIVYHDTTSRARRIVRDFQARNPELTVKTYSARTSMDRSEAIERALSKQSPTEYRLLIDSSMTLQPDTLRSGVANFISDNTLANLVFREYTSVPVTISRLVLQFQALSKNIIYKALSVTRLLPYSATSTATLTRPKSLARKSTAYTSYISYMQPSKTPSMQSLRWSWVCLILSIIIIPLATYWMITAANLRSNLLLTYSWVAVCVWLLATVWSDDTTRPARKLELSITVPFMYFLYYAHSVITFSKSLWHLIRSISFKSFATAIQAELYSTRY